jgi:hypothetical protein
MNWFSVSKQQNKLESKLITLLMDYIPIQQNSSFNFSDRKLQHLKTFAVFHNIKRRGQDFHNSFPRTLLEKNPFEPASPFGHWFTIT